MSDWIVAGQPAPDFTLPDQHGQEVRLSSFRGRPVVLYFYPKDDTPGCTREACAFRDRHQELSVFGTVVLGISPDPSEDHLAFAEKYQLPFRLLADPERTVCQQYGAWRERQQYGRTFMGLQRSTYLIGADGKVAKLWKSVKVDGHETAVLKALTALPASKEESHPDSDG